MHIRPDLRKEAYRVSFVKNENQVDRLKTGQNSGPVCLRVKGPSLPFQGTNRGIAVDAHNEHVAHGLCLFEVTHMAGMKNVKTAIGGHYFFVPAPCRGNR
ncbi:MAG: hypothetical protein A2487_15340 [Candidatus Raymondbacteria bacterium RifOxyC12_full_50_8]|nr:MAG: hypothetical protein A2487_15340 [Candidatus Raymondbacteria bacterium RifOxyC12_full_50_8]